MMKYHFKMKVIKTGSDFSGVGAFDQALQRLGIKQDKLFACDMDKYARQTYIYNFGEPKYYPENVYEREIPKDSLDIYMTSPPCQSFSLAGKRKGEDSENGVLFYNSHEFIKKNKPRYFIFENVKGLLSDNKGKTFATWCDYLGGKTVNGNPVIFPNEDSVPYHIYHKVLNAKHYNIPQNRERVFIVGIRDDSDNNFRWAKTIHLQKRLKDVLENKVDEKYFLSEKALKYLFSGSKSMSANTLQEKEYCRTLMASDYKAPPTIRIKSATKCGYEVATENDSINLTFPNSETRRGRVGVGVSQTLDTACNQGVIIKNIKQQVKKRVNEVNVLGLQKLLKTHKKGVTIKQISELLGLEKTKVEHWFRTDKSFSIPDAEYWLKLKEILKIEVNEFDKQITEFEFVDGVYEKSERHYDSNGIAPTLTCASADEKIIHNTKIRRLTPLECFRLMDFNEDFKWNVSDTQAYKQAGNSIAVGVLAGIISKLNL